MLDQRDFFREVTLLVSRRLEVEQALRDLFEYLREFMPCDVLGMYYLDEELAEFRRLARVSIKNGKLASESSDTVLSITPENMKIVLAKTSTGDIPPVKIHLPNEPPDTVFPIFEEAFHDLMETTTLGLSLFIENQVVGVLLVSAWPPAEFTPQHQELLTSVMEPIAIALSNARRYEDLLSIKNSLAEDNRVMTQELGTLPGTTVIGADEGLRGVMQLIRQVSPMSSPVLILGETGTGKELMAAAIHALSPRSAGPFVRVQCGAIPETLLDSELFGHEKGAFTGAVASKRGRFERANNGTIFLDEIGELTPEAQVKLLRALQEKEVERLGGTEIIKVDVRVVAATHRNLEQMINQELFREDLWFRLNVFPLVIPPLRERKQDIPALVLHFLHRKCRELNFKYVPTPTLEIMKKLQNYDWPGNVRELQNVVERALIVSGKGPLKLPGFSGEKSPSFQEETKDVSPAKMNFLSLDQATARHIRAAMEKCGGRIQGKEGAAELLGIQPNTLRAKMRRLGIPFGRSAQKWDGLDDGAHPPGLQ